GVGRYVFGVDGRHKNARIRRLSSIAAVASDDPGDTGADSFGVLNGGDQVRTDLFFQIAAAHGEDQQGIGIAKAADAQPVLEDAGPAFVVGAGGQFCDVVGRRVGFESTDLPEIVHGM